LERGGRELGKLVEEQNAVVCEAYLSWTRRGTATDETGKRCAVMWGAKRTDARQRSGLINPSNGMHEGCLKALIGIKWRENRAQSARQHGLPRARRPDEQQIQASGCCDFESPSRHLHPCDVSEVRTYRCLKIRWHGWGQQGWAFHTTK
jgi:hypothetical protein